MRIQLINPNSTRAMTLQIEAVARRAAAAGTVIEAVNPPATPASIEGHADEALSVPAMLDLVRQGEADGADAHVIACFDDPGLGAAREIATGPVIGICEAAVHAVTMISARFSVITSLERSVPILEDLMHAYGAERRCRRVRAVDLPVLTLESDPLFARESIAREIVAAAREDRCDAIVLGCAGMSDHCAWLQRESGLPVIDGVVAAVKFAEGLVGAGYLTSKVGAYAWPLAKIHSTPAALAGAAL
jgi:allantoin racemase